MLRGKGILLWSLLCLGPIVGHGANLIEKWGGGGTGYIIFQDTEDVTITAPGGYIFRATGDEEYGLGNIHSISVDPSCPAGTIHISVYNPNAIGAFGAWNLLKLDLSGSSATTVLLNIWVSHELGSVGDIVANRIEGVVWASNSMGAVVTDQLNGGTIQAYALSDVTLGCAAGSPAQTGSILCEEVYQNAISICGAFDGTLSLVSIRFQSGDFNPGTPYLFP